MSALDHKQKFETQAIFRNAMVAIAITINVGKKAPTTGGTSYTALILLDTLLSKLNTTATTIPNAIRWPKPPLRAERNTKGIASNNIAKPDNGTAKRLK